MKEVSIEYPETREIVGGEVHPRGTGARLAAALELLAELQWTGDIEPYHCPVCSQHLLNRHANDCRLAALLDGEA